MRRRPVSKEKLGKGAEGADQTGAEEVTVKDAAAAPAEAKAEKQPKSEKHGEAPLRAPREGKEKGGAPRGQKGQKGGRDEGEAKAKAVVVKDPPGYKPRLKALYLESVARDLREEFSYKSVMQVPRVTKIIVSTGLGQAIENKKLLDSAAAEITQITGRKPVRTKAKKSIANFKVRKGMDLGIMVTLRGNAMYEFLDRLVNVAMPRIKDFRGANPNAFDGHGNYSLGVTEQIIFPEIDYDKIERVRGMNIAVVTTAQTDAEARSLLGRLGMPFRK
jgi:large subunit ribosomal protein L5